MLLFFYLSVYTKLWKYGKIIEKLWKEQIFQNSQEKICAGLFLNFYKSYHIEKKIFETATIILINSKSSK